MLEVAVPHCLALAATVWAWRRKAGGHWLPGLLADWLPLLLVAFLYSELPILMLGLGGVAGSGTGATVYHDALIQRWEAAVFGGQPARTLAGAMPIRWLSELLHGAYLSYYAIIYVPPLVLYALGRRQAFAQCQTAVMLAFTTCFVVFVVFPVEGPRYLWPAPARVPDGWMREAVLWVLGRGSSRGTAFPSSHAAVAVAQSVTFWRVSRLRLSWVVAAVTGLLLVGAVYGGFHYAVDMMMGAVVGVVAATIAGMILGVGKSELR